MSSHYRSLEQEETIQVKMYIHQKHRLLFSFNNKWKNKTDFHQSSSRCPTAITMVSPCLMAPCARLPVPFIRPGHQRLPSKRRLQPVVGTGKPENGNNGGPRVVHVYVKCYFDHTHSFKWKFFYLYILTINQEETHQTCRCKRTSI